MEKQVEAKLVAGIKKRGGQAVKFVSPASVGWPDRLVLLPGGRVVFVELKTSKGRLSKMQEHRLGQLRGLGMAVEVLHGDDEVKEFLDGIA